jgi:hypothetical protein
MIINFWGNLKELLRPPFRGVKRVEYELTRQASIKDIVESLETFGDRPRLSASQAHVKQGKSRQIYYFK